MEETLDLDEQYKSKLIIINVLIELYTIERVALGYEKPGDKAPIDLYSKHVGLENYCDDFIRSRIHGHYIDTHECISTE